MQTNADSIFDDIPELEEGPLDEPLAEYWNPAVDTRVSENSTPVEGWGPPGGRIERVPYNARACNWDNTSISVPKLVFANFLAPNSDVLESSNNPTTSAQDGENASPSDELEEGELKAESESRVQSWIADLSTHPRTADPRLRTRADHVPIPSIRSGRHGLVITRTRYSSSPSVALSNSTVDHSISGRQPYIRSPLSISERLAEADRIITEAVHGVSFGKNSLPSLRDEPLTVSIERPKADSLFDLEYDTDSPPDLVEESSSDAITSSDDQQTGSYITVRTADCLEAMAAMRREAPTPDRDPEIRNAELEDLLEWNRQQERLQDGIRRSENNKALHPLREAMDILRVYLEDLVDRDAMRVEACGGRLWPEALAVGNQTALALVRFDALSQQTAAEDTLDLVSRRIGGGKRKVRDDLIVTVTCDGKRLRRMGGDAATWSPAKRTALHAECMRLQDYLAPLILMRGFVRSFIAQAYDLAIRRQYRIDVPSNLQGNDISLPFLGRIDFVKLSLLHSVFAAQGQKDIADDVAALLQTRFRDSRILARMLRADLFKPEDFVRNPEPMGGDAYAVECLLNSARIFSSESSAPINDSMQPLIVGASVPGPLAHSPGPPTWLLQADRDRGHDSRPQTPVDRIPYRNSLTGRMSPFRIYDDRGHYMAPPTSCKPVPVRVRRQRYA
jgi:hypothetical protein